GVGEGDAVAIQLPKGPDQVVAALGVLAAGATYVPIGFDQPTARRDTILSTADAVAVLCTDPHRFADRNVVALHIATATTYSEPITAPVLVDPEIPAYVLFTSGSTGTPKCVEVPHRAAMNTIDDLNERFGIGPADRALALSALEFDLSVYDIFGLLSAGGTVVTLDDEERADPAVWVKLIDRHRVSLLNCVPSLLDMLLTAAGDDLAHSLRVVLLGGDWVGADLPRRLARQAPGCRFAGLGGATETAIHSTICETSDPPADWAAIPYGTPLRNVLCRVVDQRGNDCPDWVTGELWIGGGGVALGYRNDPQRTAERFVEWDGRRWYRTGDLARYWPDGTLEFLGRADHQVKIRGYRVELGEVEGALRSLLGVRRAVAAVVGRTAPKLTAAVTLTNESEVTTADLVAGAAKLLPAYMVPTRIEIMGEFPLTANGKLDRKAIHVALAIDDDEVGFVAPRTQLETAVARIVAEVLDLPRVGVTDDFFALGGDSVLATSVIARIREWLDAPQAIVSDIFAARTVAELAARIDGRDSVPGRLEQVARIYLEIAELDDEALLSDA
ncbi:MAG: non-ribosomal peptide synthetase, partial [Aldersonia sp.]|nr:non-ribosomal peptide synthetase [Aldersonia sp.]